MLEDAQAAEDIARIYREKYGIQFTISEAVEFYAETLDEYLRERNAVFPQKITYRGCEVTIYRNECRGKSPYRVAYYEWNGEHSWRTFGSAHTYTEAEEKAYCLLRRMQAHSDYARKLKELNRISQHSRRLSKIRSANIKIKGMEILAAMSKIKSYEQTTD